VRASERRRLLAQRCIQQSFVAFANWMRFLRVIDYRIENAARLWEDDSCLIVANHPSLIDYVLLTSLMPRCDCIVKKSLWDNFFVRGVIRSADYIPNVNADQMLAACRQRLKAGGRILIFPEGTRSTLGQPISLQRGAANIAVRCKADIRIVRITCEPPILSKQHKWWQTAHRRPLFTVRIGEKLRISDFTREDVLPSSAARLLNTHLTRLLQSGS
jgi:1-acyl-sn-glycerol-3-phosphate acyltransferase